MQEKIKDDTISRQAAIDALDCINGTEEVLRSLPSAQPEPCEDAVSRQEAIDAVKNKCTDIYVGNLPAMTYKKEVYGVLQKLSPVTPKQKWISCSERLPEKNGLYLAWIVWPYYDEPTFSIINYDADVEAFGEWKEYYHPETLGYLDREFEEFDKVIAWMPLPEPYTKELNGGEQDDT